MKRTVAFLILGLLGIGFIGLFETAWAGEDTLMDEDMDESNALLFMSLEELMDIDVTSTSLTTIESGRVGPSTTTTITRDDIQNSGARSLVELLEMFVPNLQMILHTADARHMGLRGIISNLDDKYLLLVNGRVMNEHTDFGVMSERDLPMLRDIYQIDVVRGPGSALYGPGALAMVINITTDSAKTFQGFEISQRVGAIEEHYTTEFKFGKEFDDESGLFLYGGISHYPGASRSNSKMYYGGNADIEARWVDPADPSFYYAPYDYNEKATGANVRGYNEAFDDKPRMKLHGQYTKGDFETWVRYTQGGEYADTSHQWNIWWPLGQGYRQLSTSASYKQELTEAFSIKYMANMGHTDMLTSPGGNTYRNYGEDEYLGKVIANWQIHEDHEIAFGGTWRHDEFGLDAWGEDTATNFRFGTAGNKMPRWSTDMYSLFGEYQWRMTDKLTTFVSARQDDHSYTDHMFSPRLSVIYMPTEMDTVKFMASRSVRTNNDAMMKISNMGGTSNSEVEILKAYELRYERQVGEKVWLAGNAFYHNQDIIGWIPFPDPGRTGLTGTEKLWGFELEGSYVGDRVRVDLSHAFTKLINYDFPNGMAAGAIEDTASTAHGFGNDLNNWFNNISKVRVHYQLNEKLGMNGSMVMYWNSPGGLDYARCSVDDTYGWGGANYNPHADYVYRNNFYLNLGLEYKYSENTTMRVNGYNLLGLFNERFNMRRNGFNWSAPAQARVQPVALGFQVVHTF